MREDIEGAFCALGPALVGRLAPVSAEGARDVGRLHELLDSADGARVLLGTAYAMEESLRADEAIRAAWDDVLAAFEGGDDAERCELRLLQLRELCERRGNEWKPVENRLVGIINDDPFYIPGEPTDDLDPSSYGDRLAGVPESARLEIAADVLARPAPTGDVTVWVAFENAVLDGFYLRQGPVEFFADQLWPELIKGGKYPGHRDGQVPAELQDDDGVAHAFRGLPEENFVLARVHLGQGHLAGARQRARDLAADVLRAAWPDSEWMLMGGAASYLQGTGWGYNQFTDAEHAALIARDPPSPHEPTATALTDLDERFVVALARGDEAAVDASGHARWSQAVDAIPEAAQRIALGIRILERALPRNAEGKEKGWRGAARRYLKETWSERRLGIWLRDATFAMLSVHPGRREAFPSEGAQGYRSLEDELKPSAGGLAFYFYADAALRRLPEVASEMPEASIERRLLEEVGRRSKTGADAAAWLGIFDERFERLLARTVRQRNAILHGASTVPAVLASIEPFVAQLTGRVVAEKIYAAATGVPAVAAMENARYGSLERRARLERGDAPDQVLFQSRRENDENERGA